MFSLWSIRNILCKNNLTFLNFDIFLGINTFYIYSTLKWQKQSKAYFNEWSFCSICKSLSVTLCIINHVSMLVFVSTCLHIHTHIQTDAVDSLFLCFENHLLASEARKQLFTSLLIYAVRPPSPSEGCIFKSLNPIYFGLLMLFTNEPRCELQLFPILHKLVLLRVNGCFVYFCFLRCLCYYD